MVFEKKYRNEGRCWHCGTTQMLTQNKRGSVYCWHCYQKEAMRTSQDEIVRNYTDKNYGTILTKGRENPFKVETIGIELEVENVSKDMLIFVDYYFSQITKMKYDGSLSDQGVEIVFKPITINLLNSQEYQNQLFTLLYHLRIKGAVAYEDNGCGIHIHIGKNTISAVTMKKILHLIYKNMEFTYLISQRPCEVNGSCSWSPYNDYYYNNNCSIESRVAQATGGEFSNSSRYTAVNLLGQGDNSSVSNTIEFRIYQSNLKRESFMKNIEHAISVKRFCAGKRTLKDITIKNYYEYLLENRSIYSNLLNFISLNERLCKMCEGSK